MIQRPLAEAVTELKAEHGGDILAVGGVRFAAALAATGLVDEFQFYVNPTAAGAGSTVLVAGTRLTLVAATGYPCGITVLRYGGAGSGSSTAGFGPKQAGVDKP